MDTPPNNGLAGYFPFLAKNLELLVCVGGVSLLTGFGQFWQKVKLGQPFSVMALIGELATSFGAAFTLGFFLIDKAPLGVVVGLAGVAGHAGARGLALAERWLGKKLGASEPGVILDANGDQQKA